MTAAIAAGAASHEARNWPAINWPAVHRTVRRLQARIVKARQAGRWGKVKALQHLLTHSFSGRVLAVKRVTDNPGKHTPGIDGVLWDTPAKKAQAGNSLRHHGYRPLPLRRIHIPKSNGRKRPLGILTMKDRAMQTLHLLALDPIAECQADPNSYGFRTKRCTADAIEQCHTVLSNRAGARFVLEGDIKSCFDNISHEWLLANVPMDRKLLRKWLKAGFIERSVFQHTDEGVVQGGPISPALANLTLDGLEKTLREKYPKANAQRHRAKINYVRWADDFIITGSSKELLEHEVKPLVEAFLKERGLALSPEKTSITPIETGFDFLGQVRHVRCVRGCYA
jgi:RNA-directed DNA polymerase